MLKVLQISLDNNKIINYNKGVELDMNVENVDTNYSIIITYRNGGNRGYAVHAKNQKEAFEKLMKHINFDLVSRIEIAEIIVDQDMIK